MSQCLTRQFGSQSLYRKRLNCRHQFVQLTCFLGNLLLYMASYKKDILAKFKLFYGKASFMNGNKCFCRY